MPPIVRRILAVGNIFAAYQIDQKYPLEQFYHTDGRRLISLDRLPEELLLYATVGSNYTNEPLLKLLRTTGSVTVSPGCILGMVKMEEITVTEAKNIFPRRLIFHPVTQILRITSCVKWKVPLPVQFEQRFDRWPQASKEIQEKIKLHTQMEEFSGDD
jgi:hypothetical protein